MIHRSIFTLFFVVLGLASDAESRAFLRPAPKTMNKFAVTNHKALSIRGGAGPLEAAGTAKFATILLMTNAVVEVLAPSKAAAFYGVSDSTPRVDQGLENIGATLLTVSILAWCLFFKGTSVNGAFAASTFPWAIKSLKDILNDTPKQLGLKPAGSYLNLATMGAAGYCFFTDTYAKTAQKVLSIWTLANGVLLALAPETGSKLWGENDTSSLENFIAKSLGYCLSALGTFGLALSNDNVDSLNAFGYSWIPLVMADVDRIFITKGADEHELDMRLQFAWFFLFTLFAYTLAA